MIQNEIVEMIDAKGNLTTDVDEACAVKDKINTYVRVAQEHPMVGLYNPYEPSSTIGGKGISRVNKRSGKMVYELKPIKEHGYKAYVDFLQSRKLGLLKAAERIYNYG